MMYSPETPWNSTSAGMAKALLDAAFLIYHPPAGSGRSKAWIQEPPSGPHVSRDLSSLPIPSRFVQAELQSASQLGKMMVVVDSPGEVASLTDPGSFPTSPAEPSPHSVSPASAGATYAIRLVNDIFTEHLGEEVCVGFLA